jgi:hypothetical protein
MGGGMVGDERDVGAKLKRMGIEPLQLAARTLSSIIVVVVVVAREEEDEDIVVVIAVVVVSAATTKVDDKRYCSCALQVVDVRCETLDVRRCSGPSAERIIADCRSMYG